MSPDTATLAVGLVVGVTFAAFMWRRSRRRLPIEATEVPLAEARGMTRAAWSEPARLTVYTNFLVYCTPRELTQVSLDHVVSIVEVVPATFPTRTEYHVHYRQTNGHERRLTIHPRRGDDIAAACRKAFSELTTHAVPPATG